MIDPKDLDAFLSDLLPRLGAVAREGFENPQSVHYKSRGQIVTATDGEIERLARDAVHAAFPDHVVLGEEAGYSPGGEERARAGVTTWYIDPIDGTMNFARGIPFFSISIGIARDGRMVAGHVLDPLRREHFRSYLGGGSFLGTEPIRVSEIRDLAQANLSLQSTAGSRFVRGTGVMLDLHRRFLKIRKLGSIALELAYVAAGRLDFLLAGETRPQPWWDIAGGWMLVEEAGGALEDADGGPVTPATTHFVAGHPELIRQLRAWYDSGSRGT